MLAHAGLVAVVVGTSCLDGSSARVHSGSRSLGPSHVAEATAQLLLLELIICRSIEDFPGHLASPKVRGYLVGFFDAAAQQAFTAASLLTQSMPEFIEGQGMGGQEYFRWTQNRGGTSAPSRSPLSAVRLALGWHPR